MHYSRTNMEHVDKILLQSVKGAEISLIKRASAAPKRNQTRRKEARYHRMSYEGTYKGTSSARLS